MNTLTIIAMILAVVGEIGYLKFTGFHPRNQILLISLLLLLMAILSYFYPLIGLIGVFLVIVYYLVTYFLGQSKVKENPEDWMLYSDFETRYQDDPKEECGCYVMTVFNGPVTNQNFQNYERAYVGGSQTLHKEIHKVLNHQRLSRAYRDIQEGKQIYIRIIPTSPTEINATQQKLIETYHALPYLLSFQEVREKEKVPVK